MLKSLRKYHRQIGLVFCLPLFLTAVTGTLANLVDVWGLELFSRSALLHLHTGEWLEVGKFRLVKFYPILNGLGLLAIIATGISMLWGRRRRHHKPTDA
jgi:uncharacterized iron-regulated membrane protein